MIPDCGTDMAIALVNANIRNRARTSFVKEYTAMTLFEARVGSVRERTNALAESILQQVKRSIDMEEILGPEMTFHLGYGDRDDIIVALGSMCLACGIETRVVPEKVGEHGLTAHLEVKCEDDTWYRAPL